MSGSLILLRHGESVTNASGTFTGLLDVPLSKRGEEEAVQAAALLCDADITPDVVFTSTLQRAIRTARIVIDELRLAERGVSDPAQLWQLNERNYGELTGVRKAEALARLGPERFTAVRRSLDGLPGPMDDAMWEHLMRSPGAAAMPAAFLTRTESLREVVERVEPVWTTRIKPAVTDGLTVLVVAHGNSLRALSACIDGLSPEELVVLNLPTGHPLRYCDVDGALRPRGGEYLDPAATVAADRVAAEGGT